MGKVGDPLVHGAKVWRCQENPTEKRILRVITLQWQLDLQPPWVSVLNARAPKSGVLTVVMRVSEIVWKTWRTIDPSEMSPGWCFCELSSSISEETSLLCLGEFLYLSSVPFPLLLPPFSSFHFPPPSFSPVSLSVSLSPSHSQLSLPYPSDHCSRQAILYHPTQISWKNKRARLNQSGGLDFGKDDVLTQWGKYGLFNKWYWDTWLIFGVRSQCHPSHQNKFPVDENF